MPRPRWADLYELAAGQAGYFSAKQASGIGYSLPHLQYHLDHGKLERVQRGIFRLVQFPASTHDELVPDWLWSNSLGVFSHDTALMLHQLSDALPDNVHLTVPSTWRRRRMKVRPGLVLHYGDVPAGDRTWNGPVPVTTPLRTVADCALDALNPELVEQARTQALARGLFTEEQLRTRLSAEPAR